MLSNVHLKYRIIFGFVIISLLSLISGGISYIYLQKVVVDYDHMASTNLGNLDALSDMKDNGLMVRTKLNYLVGIAKEPEDKQKTIDLIKKYQATYEAQVKKYLEIPFLEGEEAVYKKVEAAWVDYKAAVAELIEIHKREGDSEKMNIVFKTKFVPAAEAFAKNMDELMNFQMNDARKWTVLSHEMAALATKLSIALMILCFVLSVVLGIILSRMIANQLESVIGELNQITPQLSSSASSMGSLSSELSSCATEQASSVQETASSLEEISAMIRRNSDNANSAKSSSLKSLDTVKNGQRSVANMLEAIDEINRNNDLFNEFMAKNNEELNEMVKVIMNISEKTKVINDIVFQTKLLSFNASVEAARAGEQGKGFAVVAEEVGNLAQMSGNAANEIKGLLEDSIVKVNQIVSTTKTEVEKLVGEGKQKIQMGVEKARDCDAALAEINKTVSEVESLVSEVAHASSEQSQGIEEVNKAMGQIDEVTNQNTIAAESVSTNATQVMQLSNAIKDTSDKLQILLTGGTLVTNVSSTPTPPQKPQEKKSQPVQEESKVVPLKAAAQKKKEAKPVKAAFTSAPAPEVAAAPRKKGENGLPSYDDKRFEDV